MIVSAFINLNDSNLVEKYVNNGKLLIQQPVKKVIFMDSALIDLFIPNDFTTLIPITFGDIYLSKFNVTNTINSTSPNKDTYDYFKVICNKTEWMRQATELFPEINDFIWVDFGIFYIFKNEVPDFNKNISYSRLRIASIWNLENTKFSFLNIFKDIHWYFCGGTFGGNKSTIVKFADLVKAKCLELFNLHGMLIWEVNIWYLVYLEHPELFDPYYVGDHCIKMITSY